MLTKTDITSTAAAAAQAYFDKYLGGVDRGCCGFAWVTVYPEHKGNTKLGKAERAVLRDLGFELDWTGKAFQLWNPARHRCQNVDTLYTGAVAAAALMQSKGFNAVAQSRLD